MCVKPEGKTLKYTSPLTFAPSLRFVFVNEMSSDGVKLDKQEW